MNGTNRLPRAAMACGLAIGVLAGCGKKDRDDAERASTTPTVTARTIRATTEPFAHTISAIGTVVTRPGGYAALSAPSPTRVAKIHVVAGQSVSAGQPLVEFEQVGFDAAASGAQSALVAAERNYARAERLANEGIVPRKDAEAAAAELGKARLDAVTARRAKQLSILRSPVRGQVVKMTAVLGQPADAGQVLVEVADPSAFDVVLSLGPGDAAAVHRGAPVQLASGEKAGGESLGAALVTSVGAAVDTSSRSVAVRVSVPSPRRPLRLGESVFGQISTEVNPNAVVVPAEALVPGEETGTFRVFVVDAKGVAHARDVKVGGRTDHKVEIVGGLKGGELIVAQGAFGMQDSAKVAVPVPVKR